MPKIGHTIVGQTPVRFSEPKPVVDVVHEAMEFRPLPGPNVIENPFLPLLPVQQHVRTVGTGDYRNRQIDVGEYMRRRLGEMVDRIDRTVALK